jgi:hypothetical protein
MRTPIFVIVIAFGAASAVPALAQQSTMPGQSQIQSNKQMQEEADKGIKTRDSGESGFAGEQEKPGAAARAPGQPGHSNQTTTGAGAGRGSGTGSSPR